jgi:hypothetical protein
MSTEEGSSSRSVMGSYTSVGILHRSEHKKIEKRVIMLTMETTSSLSDGLHLNP